MDVDDFNDDDYNPFPNEKRDSKVKCCCVLSRDPGLKAIACYKLLETLFMGFCAVSSTMNGDTACFVDIGITLVDIYALIVIFRAICHNDEVDINYPLQDTPKAFCISVCVLLLLMGVCFVWIFVDITSAYPYLKNSKDIEA